MKALKAYNSEAINRFHQRKVHNTEIVDTPQDEPPGPLVPENDLPNLPESDLDIPYCLWPLLQIGSPHVLFMATTVYSVGGHY